MTEVRFVDELDGVVGWLEPFGMRRASHAIAADGRVWIVDPVEGAEVDERVLALGAPAGVLQLLDRHGRDCEAFARRLGVPLHVVPDSVAGSPFRVLTVVRSRFWREVALWWPERRMLVCADALGTVPHYFRAGGELVGVHPLLRLRPPRALLGLAPLHLLVGHGAGVYGAELASALDESVRAARRRIPRWVVGLRKLRRREGSRCEHTRLQDPPPTPRPSEGWG